MSEANESQASYSVEQSDIVQYLLYSHSDDMFIILRSSINTDASIFLYSGEKNRTIQNIQNTFPQNIVHK